MKDINITLDLKKDENLVKEDIKQMIIEHLLVDGNATTNDITVNVMSGGITNKLYKIETPEKSLLCRVNGIGTEELLDRDRETKHMNMLAKYGQGPKVFFKFNNGFVYSYIPGRCLSTDEMEKYAPQIAKQMANFHKMNLDVDSGDKTESNIIRMAKKWFRDVKKFTFDGEQQQQQQVLALNLPLMEQELIQLEQLAIKYNCDMVFCHNDLLPYNIIYTEGMNNTNDNDNCIHFIDYEYCGYNYRGFDIGNHFCEHAAKIDPNLYPSPQVQTRFIKYYLAHADMGEVTEDLIEQVRVEANFFSLLVNLAWGTWAVPQAKYSNIKFDYMKYGSEKYAWYWAKRDLYIREFIEFYERKSQKQQQQQQQLQQQ